jgi:hypothetical protein
MSRIRVTIDELGLKGFAPGERKALVEALQGELTRALADPAGGIASAQSRRISALRMGQVSLAPGPAGARNLGGGIARAIGKGLNP